MDVNRLWTRTKVTSQPAFKPKGREAGLNGLRNFLRFNAIYPPHWQVRTASLWHGIVGKDYGPMTT